MPRSSTIRLWVKAVRIACHESPHDGNQIVWQVYCSESFCKISGFNRAEVMQKSCRCTFMYGEMTDKTTIAYLEQCLDTHSLEQFEILLYKKSRKHDVFPSWRLSPPLMSNVALLSNNSSRIFSHLMSSVYISDCLSVCVSLSPSLRVSYPLLHALHICSSLEHDSWTESLPFPSLSLQSNMRKHIRNKNQVCSDSPQNINARSISITNHCYTASFIHRFPTGKRRRGEVHTQRDSVWVKKKVHDTRPLEWG